MAEKEELEILCDLMCGTPQEDSKDDYNELEGLICCGNCKEYSPSEDCSVGHCMRFSEVVYSTSDANIGMYDCFVSKEV